MQGPTVSHCYLCIRNGGGMSGKKMARRLSAISILFALRLLDNLLRMQILKEGGKNI